MFGRRRRGDRQADTTEDQLDQATEPESAGGTETSSDKPAGGPADEATAETVAEGGPFDVSASPQDDVPRVDLGGMLVPVLDGTELRVDVQDDRVVAASMVYGDAALQVQAFAAPRSGGLWDEVRAELMAGISQSGGTADERLGRLGIELAAQVPVQREDGQSAFQRARFVGHDGPRWFLRGVFTGAAVNDGPRADLLETAFRSVVVVRGEDPKPPREPLELRLPPEGAEQEEPQAAEDDDAEQLEPFTRGPEITETR